MTPEGFRIGFWPNPRISRLFMTFFTFSKIFEIFGLFKPKIAKKSYFLGFC